MIILQRCIIPWYIGSTTLYIFSSIISSFEYWFRVSICDLFGDWLALYEDCNWGDGGACIGDTFIKDTCAGYTCVRGFWIRRTGIKYTCDGDICI